jgi:cytochrome P450
LSDPDNYECIHHVGSKYSKCPQFYGSFGLEYGTFITPSNEVHRQRRGRLNPLFSRKMVLELEDVVQSKAEKLCALLDKKFSVGLPIDLHHGFRAISVDVITDYGFNKCYDLLDKPDLGLNFFAMVRGIGPAMWIFQLIPGLQNVSKMIPPPVLKIMSKPLAQVLNLQEVP